MQVYKKPQNRSLILECIFRYAPISRIEISDMTNITPATVTTNVTELIGEGIVVETGELSTEQNSSGRKRVLIDINPHNAYTIGVEFTEKALVICIADLKGDITDQLILPFHESIAKRITQEIITQIHLILEKTHISPEKIKGIGIAVPGHINEDKSEIVSNNKIWKSFDPDLIRKAFPFPVVIENNVHCMTLGQYLFHALESSTNFIYFHIGHGMFCSHILNGKIYSGSNYIMGEIGHTIVEANGQLCECGKHGCLQTYASESWLRKKSCQLYEASPTTYLRSLVADVSELTIDHVLTAYSMGDPVICSYIANAIKYLGIAISNLSIIIGTQKIYLHGVLFNDTSIQTELMDFITKQLLFVDNIYHSNTEILPWNITDGAVGACALAVFEFYIEEHPFTAF